MPKWGLSMQSGKITGWLVAEGDPVAPGDELADIDTDKITGSLEAEAGGIVRRLVAKVGEDVPVSATIALIAPPGVADPVLDEIAAQARAVIDAGAPDTGDTGVVVESVQLGSRKVCYAGTGTSGDPVLLVHGYGGDRNGWLFIQEPLSVRNKVFAVDLPGHGSSSKDVGDDPNVLADSLLAVLRAIGGGYGPGGTGVVPPGGGAPPRETAAPAHLVGHSLGGAAVLAVAAQAPELVASLTLFAPAGFGPAINASYIRGFAAATSRRELKPVVGQLFADDKLVTRQLVEDLLAYKRLDGVDAALGTLADWLLTNEGEQRFDSAAALRSLAGKVPVTVVWGSADAIIPAGQAAAVTAADPSAVVRVIDGAGHMPHLERPAESLAAIADTIARAG
jgi:pyruvate dehydrogenase E2 component (dihydrolipoamide acetyltransferase)